jgi:transposase-like protein
MASVSPPAVCPRCGAVDAYRARYTTGGGWRIDHYWCTGCGRRHDPRSTDKNRE